ncbi:MAG: OmpA family protein [Flavisolibacter sp.]|jgi:outer membrane protein OmpA-like peptidoglycan-associated protein/Tol biopolymer transport system component|nr:OmpA family protein [Flavisolibacter sp.]
MINRVPLLLAGILFTITSFGQYDASKVNKKAIESYNKAIEKVQDGKYKDAVEALEEAIRRDAKYVDAYLSLGGIFGQLKNYQASVATYENAFKIDANYTFGYKLPYAINLAGLGQFQKALDEIELLLTKQNLHPNTKKAAEYRKKTFQFAVAYEKQHKDQQYVFTPINLGDAINSSESEYFPSMPVDGSQLIFTRRLNNFNEDFFGSRKEENTWNQAVRLNGSINTPMNEGAQNISQDGNWLVFTGCNRQDGFGSCDLYISYLTNDGWSEAMNLGRNINTDQWESQPCLSPDKRDLYFTSRRPGGFGGSDLYVSRLQANGKWSTPENLGPEINTAGDESSPFIHADNQTLYFASTGLPGYGEEDLFVVRKKSDGTFGKPENLGYPINTISHEGTIFIESNGRTAYYASDRSDSRGGLDIYQFEIRDAIRPAKTLWVKGKVFDNKTKLGLPSTVELIDLATKQLISRVQTDETGNYLITLPVGKDYAFNVSRRGYLFYSDHYSLKEKDPDATYEKNIPLQPIEADAAIVLNNVFFDVNKFDLKPESQVELDQVIQLLKDNPTIKIQIEGHTDNAGNAADNQKLSENRARSVIQYLISKGIKADRLLAKGFGATKPVADNNTEEGRALNRRTGLKILSK